MDDKLHIIQHLYGEADASSDRERFLEDEALRAEYELLSGVKFHLDQRPKQRPDTAVLDAVLAAAATASGQPALRSRQDRSPQPRNAARRYSLFGMVSAVVAVLMVAGIGLYQMQQGGFLQAVANEPVLSEGADTLTDQAAPLAEQKEESKPSAEPPPVAYAEPASQPAMRPEAVAAAPPAQPLMQSPAPMESRAVASGFAAAKTEADAQLADDADAEDSVPAWDASDEVLRVHRHLEMVETRSPEFAWGDSLVMSLDVLPTNPRARDTVTPASTRRGNH